MTTIHYNVPGSKRKELVKAIAAWTGTEFSYAGAPTFAYHADGMEIDRNGNLKLLGTTGGEAIERLMQHLHDEGFECDMNESTVEDTETAEEQSGIAIQMPMMDETAIENLKALVDAKGSLIRQAIGADSLPIEEIDGGLDFPWFPADSTPEEIQTYMKFITKLCEMAKNAKRVTAKEKESANPKYEFRCFLLRLGFIGDEYKADRKLLLKNLSGSSAFKSGKAKEAAVCSE